MSKKNIKKKFVSKVDLFLRLSKNQLNNSLERMSKDIKNISSQRVPFLKGDLQKETRVIQVDTLNWQVRNDKEYASYQEKGMRADGSRVVKNYTTPSTGKNWMKNAGKTVGKNGLNYLKQAAQQVKL